MPRISERTFSVDDQHWFAQASRDRNPIHVDPVAARRLLAGRPVVHGMNLLLTALDQWQSDGARPVTVSCTFNNPVFVGDTVVFSQAEAPGGDVLIELTTKDLLCARVLIGLSSEPTRPSGDVPGADAIGQGLACPEVEQPLDEEPQSHVGRQYFVPLGRSAYSDTFPQAGSRLGEETLSAVAALSYFVGMICPGQHSLLSSVTFVVDTAAREKVVRFTVQKFDARYSLFNIAFDGPVCGVLTAFQRPRPQAQPSIETLRAHVGAGEFTGTRSLVIGGSRGLGEITAKLLATGGGDVVITYATGRADAERVCNEIAQAARGRCTAIGFDVTRDAPASRGIDAASLDAVYFFATPPIFKKQAAFFDDAVFQEFYRVYVRAMYDLCVFLEANATTRKMRIYVPSTVAVASRPKGMTEYAMAKSAAELLIADINRSFKKLTVVTSRLPRLSTDQTASILPVSAQSNIETLLPIVRSVTGSDG